MNYEAIVVGGGHNGLICAAYLARARIETILVEARSSVGGCASTVSDLGARFNICNCDHTMIRALPLIDELGLSDHGLSYVEPELTALNAFYDDAEPWPLFHEAERTLEHLAYCYPSQLDGYRRYLADAMPVASLIVELATTQPGLTDMLATVGQRRGAGAVRLLNWARQSMTEVLAEYFGDWRMIMPAASTGPTVWGVSPEMPGTGLAAVGYALRHTIKTGRPRGGSGALTNAIRDSFLAAGGHIRCNSTVQRLLLDDDKVHGVRMTDDSEETAKVLVAACDPQRVLVDWIGEVPTQAAKLAQEYRRSPTMDGYESKIDAVFSELPVHRGSERLRGDLDLLGVTTVVSPSPEQLDQAHKLRAEGRVAENPTLLFNMPTVPDEDMFNASGGRHVLSLEALFTPYALEGGWPNSPEPARWLKLWEDFMEPGAREDLVDWRVMTPDRYETEFHMHRGHTPSFAGSPLSTLVGKRPELTRYRTPIDGLYFTGAATYPGAGIFGASGRNTAGVVAGDLDDATVR